jgi:hypothetical protein
MTINPGRIANPYCVEKLSDNKYQFLNRNYEPIETEFELIDDTILDKHLSKVSRYWFFYDDGCLPFNKHPKLRKYTIEYLKKLNIFRTFIK